MYRQIFFPANPFMLRKKKKRIENHLLNEDAQDNVVLKKKHIFRSVPTLKNNGEQSVLLGVLYIGSGDKFKTGLL
jgi:hypothetical protein